MIVNDIVKKLDCKVVSGEKLLDRQVEDCYVCDLISWVIGRCEENSAWLTVMTNINVVAVAVMADIPCVVVCDGAACGEDMIKKAEAQEVVLLETELSSYRAAVKISEILGK